ncbi:MAG TPA: hypothetical protein VJA25_02060 [Dehalococcoidia bacterium]|nr:hypothetical protein [Dehalococcoidia bacterium]
MARLVASALIVGVLFLVGGNPRVSEPVAVVLQVVGAGFIGFGVTGAVIGVVALLWRHLQRGRDVREGEDVGE